MNSPTKEREPPTTFNKNIAQKEPLKCWECGEEHYFKDCIIRNRKFNIHSIQEVLIVGYMERIMLRISAALENYQVDHQTSMVEIEDMIKIQSIYILIDPGASLSYI